MKKLLLFLIALIFLAVSCGSSKKAENSGSASNDSEPSVDEDSPEKPDENEEEDEDAPVPDNDTTAEDAVCNPNPCKNMEHSNGKCEFDGDKSYVCHCKEGFYWEDYRCTGPCDGDPCKDVAHSTGCYAIDRETYSCKCEEDYFWEDGKCFDPCDDDPCPAHSTCYSGWRYGEIYYDCFCEGNYFEADDSCISPCDPNPCQGISNSTGKCEAKNKNDYSCECNENYVFSKGKGCISPCDENPCAGRENSTGICLTISESGYSCGCKDGFAWSGTSEGCTSIPECSPSNTELCKDSESGIMWSSRSEEGGIPGYPELDSFLVTFTQAENYCKNLKQGGFADWRLPTIDELRTLVVNCPKVESGGACRVSDAANCLSIACYSEEDCTCQGENDYAVFSKFGYEQHGIYWSSSSGIKNGEKFVWGLLMTGDATLATADPEEDYLAQVRCVHK